jgi:hypothetical protein
MKNTKTCDMGKEIHKLYNDTVILQPEKYVNQIKEILSYYN